MRRQILDVVLSPAGQPDQTFSAQALEFERPDTGVVMSGDGYLTTYDDDTIVRWRGGTAKLLERVGDFRAVAADGTAVVNGYVNRNRTAPSDLPGGVVEFAVFEGK